VHPWCDKKVSTAELPDIQKRQGLLILNDDADIRPAFCDGAKDALSIHA
jgi:hypothetical protein